LEELETVLLEKNDLLVNKALNIDEIREIMLQRVDLDKTSLSNLMKKFA